MAKQTTYEVIKKIESDPFCLELMRRGIITLKILDYKVYYERYLSELQRVSICQAITNTAEEFNVSERTIRNAINYMK
jgi:hypothetical protein